MIEDQRLDCDPLAAYEGLFDRFTILAGRLGLALSETDLRLAAWIALDELLARLSPPHPDRPSVPALLRNDLPEPTAANLERALAVAATQRLYLTPPDDAPEAVEFAYRLAEALLTAIWVDTTIH